MHVRQDLVLLSFVLALASLVSGILPLHRSDNCCNLLK